MNLWGCTSCSASFHRNFQLSDLLAKKIEGDFEISRIRPAQPYLLKQEESKRQETFFTERSVPNVLAQSIEAVHYKKGRKRME